MCESLGSSSSLCFSKAKRYLQKPSVSQMRSSNCVLGTGTAEENALIDTGENVPYWFILHYWCFFGFLLFIIIIRNCVVFWSCHRGLWVVLKASIYAIAL